MNFIAKEFDFNDESLVSCCDELPLWSAPFGGMLFDMIDYRKGIVALDIGSGTGFPLLELAMRLGSSSILYGVDPWRAGHLRTANKIRQYGMENVTLLESVAEHLPLDAGSVDCIVSNNGLNNVADMNAVIKECARVARPGCQFLLTMNCDATMHEFYEVLRETFRENGLEKSIGVIDSHIRKKRPELNGVIEMVSECGFTMQREQHDTFTMKFADGTALLNHYFIRLAFLESWVSCIPGGRRDSIMKDVELRMNGIASEQGSFSMSVPYVCLDFSKV